jgi:hypothetical protein
VKPSKDVLPSVGDEIQWISGMAKGQIAKITAVNARDVELEITRIRDVIPAPGSVFRVPSLGHKWPFMWSGIASSTEIDWIPANGPDTPRATEPAWLTMPNGACALSCQGCSLAFTHVGPNQPGLLYRCPSCR